MQLTIICLMAEVAVVGAGQARPIRVVAFGDSTTAPHEGVKQVYTQRLAKTLKARGIEVEVINAGVSGDTTADARKRFEKDVLGHEPDLVVIQFGLNDSAVDVPEGRIEPQLPRQAYEQNLDYFVKTLESRGIRVILMTQNPVIWTDELRSACGRPPYNPDDRWGFNVLNQQYAESARGLARTHDVPLIDVYRHYLDYDQVPGQTADSLLSDGVHPNDEGHTLVAELLARQIDALARSLSE
jgi:lysophospholipase L1-like esterase